MTNPKAMLTQIVVSHVFSSFDTVAVWDHVLGIGLSSTTIKVSDAKPHACVCLCVCVRVRVSLAQYYNLVSNCFNSFARLREG